MKAAQLLVWCVFGALLLSASARLMEAQQFGNGWGGNNGNNGNWNGNNGGNNWNGNNGGNKWGNNNGGNNWNGNNGGNWNGGWNNNPWGNPCACATPCTGMLSRCSLLAGTGTCAPVSGLQCPSAFTDVLGSIKVCCSNGVN